jgi:hypothetical protein
MTPNTRASVISSRAAEKLVNERVTPSITSESRVKELFSPKKAASTVAAALLVVEWPERYTG